MQTPKQLLHRLIEVALILAVGANLALGQESSSALENTFTDYHAYKPDSPLLECGLLGPVRVVRSCTVMPVCQSRKFL